MGRRDARRWWMGTALLCVLVGCILGESQGGPSAVAAGPVGPFRARIPLVAADSAPGGAATQVTWELDPSLTQAEVRYLEDALNAIDARARLELGSGVSPITIIAYRDPVRLAQRRAEWEGAPVASIGDRFACELCAEGLYDAVFLRIGLGWFDEGRFPDQMGRATFAHEIFHVLQWRALGRPNSEVAAHTNPSLVRLSGPNWLTEGGAQWWGWHSAIEDLRLSRAALLEYDRRRTADDPTPLETMESPSGWQAAISEFGVGHVAVEFLLGGRLPRDLMAYYERIGSGQVWQTAWANTFGEPVADFYSRFRAYRAAFTGSRFTISGGLTSVGGTVPVGAFVNACPAQGGFCIGGRDRTRPDGTFAIPVPAGSYWLNVNVPSTNDPLGWYREGGTMVSSQGAGATVITITDAGIAGVIFRIP